MITFLYSYMYTWDVVYVGLCAWLCVSPLLTLFPTLTRLTARDWLAAKHSLHTQVHTNTPTPTHTPKGKVHYPTISGSTLILMGNSCKVLGEPLSHTSKNRHLKTQPVTHTCKKKKKTRKPKLCFLLVEMLHFSSSLQLLTYTHPVGPFSNHLKCLAVVDNNDQKSPWEGLVRRWAVFFTKTTHYSTPCLDEWLQWVFS